MSGVDDARFEEMLLPLLEFCQKFIQDQNITCSETVYQSDRVIENAYEFIDGICDIVGFKDADE